MAVRKKKVKSARRSKASSGASKRPKHGRNRGSKPAKKKQATKKKPTSRKRPTAKKATTRRPTAKKKPATKPSRPQKPAAKRGKTRAATARRPAKKTGGAASRKKLTLAQRQRERERKAREAERARRQREREQQKRQRERERAQRERERERERKAREAARLKKQREAERARLKKQKERERLAAKREREKERQRKQAEKLAEKQRKQAERERLRMEALQRKEEERKKREAEREAYNKAKEAERVKLRAQREAARRALEGKVARATRRANRIGGVGRGATARVYRPDSIPNQTGTTRRAEGEENKFANLRPLDGEARPLAPSEPTPAPEPPPPPAEDVIVRYSNVLERMQRASEPFRREYQENLDMSWIYHDSALEGVVYTYQELKTAIDPNITIVPDSSLQPVCEEIRRHKAAIDWVRELAEKKRAPVTVDTVKRLYLMMHPEDGDLKTLKYRKDIPQHRLYFHEYAPPDKIAHRVRQAIEWLNGPEAKKLKNPLRVAAKVHYDLVRAFPFSHDSGKVARLVLNLLLLRSGHPAAIIHSTERQRYYEALRGSFPTILNMISDSIHNALASIEKLLDEHERKR